MNEILFEILKCTVIVCCILISTYLVPFIRSYTEKSQNELLVSLVSAAVNYAEQTISSPRSGAEKKAIVTKFLKELLIKKNISITDDQLSVLIEAAVKQMKTEEKMAIPVGVYVNDTKDE